MSKNTGTCMKYVLAEDFPSVVFYLQHVLIEKIRIDPKDIESVGNSDDLLAVVGNGGYENALLILDLSMPGRYRRLPLVKELLRRNNSLLIVVYTAYNSAHLAKDLLQQGVKGYVTKGSPPKNLVAAIETAFKGGTYTDPTLNLTAAELDDWHELTASEKEITIAICKQLSNVAIAKQYGVTPKTVSAHKRSAMAKLGISRETHLQSYLFEQGLDYLLDE